MAAGGTSVTPSSRCITRRPAPADADGPPGTPTSSEITSIGSLPANSVIVVEAFVLQRGLEMFGGELQHSGLGSRIRRGVKPFDFQGGDDPNASMARNIAGCASGVRR